MAATRGLIIFSDAKVQQVDSDSPLALLSATVFYGAMRCIPDYFSIQLDLSAKKHNFTLNYMLAC